MKDIQKFTTFNESSTQAKGVDVRNGNSKIINDDPRHTIDLGFIDDVSDTDIVNIQQTYKNSELKTVDGHYILMIEEGTIIRFSDIDKLDEGVYDIFATKNPEKNFNNITDSISKDTIEKIADLKNRTPVIQTLAKSNININENEYQRLINKILRTNGDEKHKYFYGKDSDDKNLNNDDIENMKNILSIFELI